MEASGATPSSSCSSPGENTHLVTSTSEAGGSNGSNRDPRLVDRAGSQPWLYYTCPKNCGFRSRNKDRFDNHLKNCGTATTKKGESSRHAPRADVAFGSTVSDRSLAAGARVEPIKILICPKCGYKSSKKARMDIHSCNPATQLKAKEAVLVPEVAAKQKEQSKQHRSTTPVELPRLKCSHCGFCTTDRNFLFNHEKMHVVKSQFQCPHCTYSVGNQGHLARHTNRDHPELPKLNDDPQVPINVEPVNKEPSTQTQEKELPKVGKSRNEDAVKEMQPAHIMNKELPKKRIHPVFNDPRRHQNVEPEKRRQDQQPMNKESTKKRVESNDPRLLKSAPKDPPPKEAPTIQETPQKRRGRSKGPVIFECRECDFTATYSFGLKQHEKCHQRDGKFKCDLCSYTAQMQRHVNVHAEKYHVNGPKEVSLQSEEAQRAVTPDPPKNTRKAVETPKRDRQREENQLIPQREVTPDPSKKIRNAVTTPKRDRSAPKSYLMPLTPEPSKKARHAVTTPNKQDRAPPKSSLVPSRAATPDPYKKTWNATVTPRRERTPAAKPVETIPVEQLDDLGATGGEQDDDEEEEVDALPDLTMDYFLLLEDTFATFEDRQITLEDIEDLVEKTKEKVDGLDAPEVRFVEDIGLVASALYDTYLSIEEEFDGGFIHDEELDSLKNEIEEMERRVRMGSKEIRRLSNQQDSLLSKITQLGAEKVKAEMVVNKCEYATLQLKLNANQSASTLRAYQDAMDQVRRSKDRVYSLDNELGKAEEESEDLAAELEEVEEENAQDTRHLLMLKKEYEELETTVATQQDSEASGERMKELQEKAVKQRKALSILHDQLIKLTYVKTMERIDAEEKEWLEMLDNF